MNMQVLLEKSSIFTEVLKDQMDRTREKHAAVAVATLNPNENEAEAAPGAVWAARIGTKKTRARGE